MSFLSTHPAVKSEYLSTVRAVTGGAAPFGPALIEKFKEKCAPNEVSFREGNKNLFLKSSKFELYLDFELIIHSREARKIQSLLKYVTLA